MMKRECHNPQCVRFGARVHTEDPLGRCEQCGWCMSLQRPLFNYPRLVVAVLAGSLVGWAVWGWKGAWLGMAMLVLELLYGDRP